MNIHSTGVDLSEIKRMERIIRQHGRRFLEKVFTQVEIDYCTSKITAPASFAARFAAKEALLKALGTGLRGKFRWKDIEIVNDTLGKPEFRFYGETKRVLNGQKILLSISHTVDLAIAFVVIVHPDPL